MDRFEIKKLVDIESERLGNTLSKDMFPGTYKDWIDNMVKMYEKGMNDLNRVVSNNQGYLDEKELEELAWYEAFKKYDIHSENENIMHHRDGFAEGFKVGYKKAME